MQTRFILVAALLAPLGTSMVIAQDATATATSSLNREDYSDRSAQELRQLRAEVDEFARHASQPGEERFASIYDALNDAEDALAAWKTADALEAPQRRADYERAHTRAVRLWNDFHTTQRNAP